MHWRNFTNASVLTRLGQLAKARNELAHGRARVMNKSTLKGWRLFIEGLPLRLDEIAIGRVQAVTGARPW